MGRVNFIGISGSADRGLASLTVVTAIRSGYGSIMLYVVGGCSRSGKSMLADRMCARHGIPWFSLDALKMGLHLGAPALGVMPAADDLDTADRMWPVVEPLLDHAVFDRRNYLVEVVNLRPAMVARYIRDGDQPVAACFLGYLDLEIDTKARFVEDHIGPPTDWLHRTGPENVRRYLEVSRQLSRMLRDECHLFGIPFVDTGTDFRLGLDAAERALLGRADSETECHDAGRDVCRDRRR